jgi:hypothetical protein
MYNSIVSTQAMRLFYAMYSRRTSQNNLIEPRESATIASKAHRLGLLGLYDKSTVPSTLEKWQT